MIVPDQSSRTVVKFEAVSFRRGTTQILDQVSFTVPAGEHWVLHGPNGAGKSTIVGLCGATTHPTSGMVRVLGEQIGRVELQALRRRMEHVNPRHPLRSPLTVREVVLTGLTGTIETPLRWAPTAEQNDTVDKLLSLLGMAAHAGDRWTTVSQGERGRQLSVGGRTAPPWRSAGCAARRLGRAPR